MRERRDGGGERRGDEKRRGESHEELLMTTMLLSLHILSPYPRIHDVLSTMNPSPPTTTHLLLQIDPEVEYTVTIIATII